MSLRGIFKFYFWLCWVFIAACGLFYSCRVGATLVVCRLLTAVASLVVEHGL